jgi:hypothetical protein
MNQYVEELLLHLQLKQGTGNENQAASMDLYERMRKARTALPEAILEKTMQQIHSMLPDAEKKYGANHPTYLFYVDLLLICAWCARYKGMIGQANQVISNQKLEIEILRRQLQLAEKELNRFETVDDLLLTGTLDHYLQTCITRMEQFIPNHPRAAAFKEALNIVSK